MDGIELGNGRLTAVVWPAYVGVTDAWGAEPVDDYVRGQIYWATTETGVIFGRASILVPAGQWADLVYFHHPTSPLMVGRQHIDFPFDYRIPGAIIIDQITPEDFTQQVTPSGYRLPLVTGNGRRG